MLLDSVQFANEVDIPYLIIGASNSVSVMALDLLAFQNPTLSFGSQR